MFPFLRTTYQHRHLRRFAEIRCWPSTSGESALSRSSSTDSVIKSITGIGNPFVKLEARDGDGEGEGDDGACECLVVIFL